MIFPLTAFRIRVVLLFLLVFILPASMAHGAPSYPIELSPDGSYLVDQGNNPFFINGDTAWSLIVATLAGECRDLFVGSSAEGVQSCSCQLNR